MISAHEDHLWVQFGAERWVWQVVNGLVPVPQSEGYRRAVGPLHSRRRWRFLQTDPELCTRPGIWETRPKTELNTELFMVLVRPAELPGLGSMLTVSQKAEQHLHLRQEVKAAEVPPQRPAGPGRVLPASRFGFWQNPVAEPVMRPPIVCTLGPDVLPVLWKRKTMS